VFHLPLHLFLMLLLFFYHSPLFVTIYIFMYISLLYDSSFEYITHEVQDLYCSIIAASSAFKNNCCVNESSI
jgi:hypothetical protein